MRTLLPQETYDILINRLGANHKAHRCDSHFDLIRSQIERTAQTTEDGVWVDIKPTAIARNAIAQNVKLVGGRYQSGGDEILIFLLDQAFEGLPKPHSEPVLSDAARADFTPLVAKGSGLPVGFDSRRTGAPESTSDIEEERQPTVRVMPSEPPTGGGRGKTQPIRTSHWDPDEKAGVGDWSETDKIEWVDWLAMDG